MDDVILNEVENILHLSFEEKVDLGRDSLGRLVRGLKEGGLDKEQVSNVIWGLIRLFVSADKRCSNAEYVLFKEITQLDISEDEFYERTNGGADEEFKKAILDFISILTREDAVHAIVFGVTVMSSDGIIAKGEYDLIDQLMGN